MTVMETTAQERARWATWNPGLDEQVPLTRILRDFARLEAEHNSLRAAAQVAADALMLVNHPDRQWHFSAALAHLAEQGVKPGGGA